MKKTNKIIVEISHDEILNKFGIDCHREWGNYSLAKSEKDTIVNDISKELDFEDLPVTKVEVVSPSISNEFHSYVPCSLEIHYLVSWSEVDLGKVAKNKKQRRVKYDW